MNLFPTLTGKEVAKAVEKMGFEHLRTKGSHMTYKHKDGRKIIIPCHSGENIGPGLLNKIIKKDLRMTKEEFFKKIRK